VYTIGVAQAAKQYRDNKTIRQDHGFRIYSLPVEFIGGRQRFQNAASIVSSVPHVVTASWRSLEEWFSKRVC